MNEAAQIEQIAKIVCQSIHGDFSCTECGLRSGGDCLSFAIANNLYNEGYCIPSVKTAENIFEELNKFIVTKVIHNGAVMWDYGDKYIALKEKYASGYCKKIRDSKGEWLKIRRFPFFGIKYRCSHCGEVSHKRKNYCPNCGRNLLAVQENHSE